MLKIKILPDLGRSVESPSHEISIVGMNSLKYQLQRGLNGSIIFKDVVGFLRPVDLSADNVPAETSRMAKPLRLRQIGLARAQFLLRPLALGDVDHGAHELNQIAGWAENGMAHHVDVSNLAAGMNDSVILLEICFHTQCCLGGCRLFGLIIRMDALEERFESRLSTVRVKTQHAVAFLGPVPNVTRSRNPCPTARMAEPLRFRQVCLALLKRLFRLPCCGDVRHGAHIFDVP